MNLAVIERVSPQFEAVSSFSEIKLKISEMDVKTLKLADVAIDNFLSDPSDKSKLFVLIRYFGKCDFQSFSQDEFVKILEAMEQRELELSISETKIESIETRKNEICGLEFPSDFIITPEFAKILTECKDYSIIMKLKRFLDKAGEFFKQSDSRLVSSLDYFLNNPLNPKLPNGQFSILNSKSYNQDGMGGHGKLILTLSKRIYLKPVNGKFELYALPNLNGIH